MNKAKPVNENQDLISRFYFSITIYFLHHKKAIYVAFYISIFLQCIQFFYFTIINSNKLIDTNYLSNLFRLSF